MKLRSVLILATMVLGVMLFSGMLLAKDKLGDSKPNTLKGTKSTDHIWGGGGGDNLGGKEGRDWIYGQGGGDRMHGGRGHDEIDGGLGTDTAWGDEGNDDLAAEDKTQGSYQAAKVKGGRKPDKLLGGRGNDIFRAKDGKKDIIRGGPGRDKAYVDRVDKVKGVEVVRGRGGNKPPGDGNKTPPGDKPPVAVYDNPTVEERNCESDPPRTLDVLNNDKNDDGGPMTIESVTQPTNGTVAITGGGSGLTYEPVVDYWNDDTDGTVKPPDHFTYTLNGGSKADVNVIVEGAGGLC